jgi:hypothetical protein
MGLVLRAGRAKEYLTYGEFLDELRRQREESDSESLPAENP